MQQLNLWQRSFLVVAALTGFFGWAGGLEQLKFFNAGTDDLSGDFYQTVTNNKGIKKSSGVFAISRPGFFRWEYITPYKQIIIGDGINIWLYDQDLAQVVKKRQSEALGGSPAAILASKTELERSYVVREHGKKNGVEYILATPKNDNSGYQYIEIGFKNNLPVSMQIKDSFGSQSFILLTSLTKTPVKRKKYQFTPPPDTDILAE